MNTVISKKNNRNVGVELARIVACVIVIGCHVNLGVNDSDSSRIFVAMIFADGVSVFWLIMGFYLFQNTDYKRLVSRTTYHVAIPAAITSVIAFYVYPWIWGEGSFLESICKGGKYYKSFFSQVVICNPTVGCGHLWYVYIYLIIILLFPLIKPIAVYLNENKRAQNLFVIISVALLIINDFTLNGLLSFSHHTIGGVAPALIYVFLGYILYDRLKDSRKLALGCVLFFIIMNYIRTIFAMKEYAENLNWYSFPGAFSAVCILIFSFATVNRKENPCRDCVIRYLGGLTYTVYLIHMFVVDGLYTLGVQGKIYLLTADRIDGFKGEALYTVFILVIVAIISFAIAAGINGLMRLGKGCITGWIEKK